VDRSAEFGYALWAKVPNQLPERRSTQQFLKACDILYRNCDAKNCLYCIETVITMASTTQVNLWYLYKKLVLLRVTAGYFYDTFAYEICFYGIYYYGIYIYGIYIYKALKFLSIDCTVVRNT
jgi:hypothetical protein